MGASEKEDSAAANQATYSVFWWSSRTIRAASMRRAVLKGTMTQADAEKTLVECSRRLHDFGARHQHADLSAPRRRSISKDRVHRTQRRPKQKLYPTKVAFTKGSDGTVNGAVFYFSKKGAGGEPSISPDEKEIDFYLQMGGAKLLTYFDPRKMVDSKGEDL